jgi:hypothetical protein
VEHSRGAIDVGAVQPEQFLGPQAAPDSDHGDRPVTRNELGRDRVDVLPSLERTDLAPLMPLALRVTDALGRVLLCEVALDRPRERLPEGPEDVGAAASWKALPPVLELDAMQ